MIVDDWGSFSLDDVSAFLPTFYNGGADDYTMDPEVTAAVNKGGSTNNKPAREAAYRSALKRIAEQAYTIPLFTMPVNYAFSSTLDMPIRADEIPEFWRARWK
jgi:peptide/nickel transport system substrate-binding protein